MEVSLGVAVIPEYRPGFLSDIQFERSAGRITQLFSLFLVAGSFIDKIWFMIVLRLTFAFLAADWGDNMGKTYLILSLIVALILPERLFS